MKPIKKSEEMYCRMKTAVVLCGNFLPHNGSRLTSSWKIFFFEDFFDEKSYRIKMFKLPTENEIFRSYFSILVNKRSFFLRLKSSLVNFT